MPYVPNVAATWITPSGALPAAVFFDVIPGGQGWMIVVASMAIVCLLLAIVRYRAPRSARGTCGASVRTRHVVAACQDRMRGVDRGPSGRIGSVLLPTSPAATPPRP